MKYTYAKNRYVLGVVAPATLALYFTGYNFLKLNSGMGTVLNQLFFVICGIAFIDYIFALSNPKEVEITKDEIIIRGFAGQHVFQKNDLDKLLVRRFYDAKKIYLRIGKTSILRGRYWIQLEHYSNSDHLLEALLTIEDSLHPMLNKFHKRSSKSKQTA